jgi:hypothetical protein
MEIPTMIMAAGLGWMLATLPPVEQFNSLPPWARTLILLPFIVNACVLGLYLACKDLVDCYHTFSVWADIGEVKHTQRSMADPKQETRYVGYSIMQERRCEQCGLLQLRKART